MTPAWLRDLRGADPYQLLRVADDATATEITRAHRQLIREFHPDRTGDDHTDVVRRINLARDILLNPLWRAEYDRYAAGPEPAPLPSSAWDTEDVVIGAEPPSAWDTEDVMAAAAPPPPPPHGSPYPPGYDQPYPAQPPPPLSLPIAALVCSFMCAPLGLILGLVAFAQHRHWRGTGRTLAIVAVAASGGFVLLTCVCYGGFAVLSTTQSA
jgi:hypothetical protein